LNFSTQIGIDKNLEKELINNKLFKTQLKSYLDTHISRYKELMRMVDINFKIRDGTITSECIISIGKITIFQDVKTESKKTVHLMKQTNGKCKITTNILEFAYLL